VGGAAYHAGKRVQEGRDADYERDARLDQLEQQQYQQQAPPPAATGPTDENLAQLEKLGQLREQGILTDEEFQQQKRKLLGI
jgi:hypothetical protein